MLLRTDTPALDTRTPANDVPSWVDGIDPSANESNVDPVSDFFEGVACARLVWSDTHGTVAPCAFTHDQFELVLHDRPVPLSGDPSSARREGFLWAQPRLEKLHHEQVADDEKVAKRIVEDNRLGLFHHDPMTQFTVPRSQHQSQSGSEDASSDDENTLS